MELTSSRFGLAFDKSLMAHDATGLPEVPARIESIERAFRAARLFERSHPIHFVESSDTEQKIATLAWAAQNHSPEYLEHFEKAFSQGVRRLHNDSDTPIGEHTFDCAWRYTHAVLSAVEKVMQGEITNALCIGRPPGHHAIRDRAMGFCYINHVAVAAQLLLQKYGMQRVGIFDFDVHHSNGAQETLWNEPRVLVSSIHGNPEDFWPYQGWEHETGGAGNNILNIPMKHHSSREAYREAFLRKFIQRMEAFKPEFLLISAGFDAHVKDKFNYLKLTDEDYYWIAEQLTELANRYCKGRLVALLEGGYNLDVLGGSVLAFAEGLAKAAAKS